MPLQFSTDKADILAAVAQVQSVVDNKNSIPVLANLLFQVDATTQRAVVTATNLEIGSQTAFPIQTVDSGAITIPAKKLFEILRELPDAPVTLTVDDKNWVTIDCLKATFRLAGLPQTDFPALPALAEAQELSFSGSDLADLLNATLFAVSHDESRYSLCGVNFDFEPSCLTVVATDGHRLACKTYQIDTAEVGNLILPLRGANELKKLCGTRAITLRWNANTLHATDGASSLFMRLIEGTFPAYQQVIPSGSMVCTAVVPIADLQRTLRRVALLCSDTRLVKLSFAEHTLTISATDPNTGEANDSLACQYNDMNLTVGVNARYLLDSLQTITSGEQVTIRMNDPLSPLLLTCDDSTRKQVIMPMRV